MTNDVDDGYPNNVMVTNGQISEIRYISPASNAGPGGPSGGNALLLNWHHVDSFIQSSISLSGSGGGPKRASATPYSCPASLMGESGANLYV